MAVREILRIGHPLLRGVARPVSEFGSDALQALIADMTDTMCAADGAGLAAPQIGVPLRVVVFGVEANPRYPDAGPVPFTVLINPRIEILDATPQRGWEGCLSVPGMRGLVPRARVIRYRGYDARGAEIRVDEASGFHARVVLHECDHLDGVLYPQRIEDLRLFGYEAELLDLIMRWPEGPPASASPAD